MSNLHSMTNWYSMCIQFCMKYSTIAWQSHLYGPVTWTHGLARHLIVAAYECAAVGAEGPKPSVSSCASQVRYPYVSTQRSFLFTPLVTPQAKRKRCVPLCMSPYLSPPTVRSCPSPRAERFLDPYIPKLPTQDIRSTTFCTWTGYGHRPSANPPLPFPSGRPRSEHHTGSAGHNVVCRLPSSGVLRGL